VKTPACDWKAGADQLWPQKSTTGSRDGAGALAKALLFSNHRHRMPETEKLGLFVELVNVISGIKTCFRSFCWMEFVITE